MSWSHIFTCVLMITSMLIPLEASVERVLGKIAYRACESESDVVLIIHNDQVIGNFGARRMYEPIDSRGSPKLLSA